MARHVFDRRTPSQKRSRHMTRAMLALSIVFAASDVALAESKRDKEMSLALEAGPPEVTSKAGIYVLDKTGYVKARESQNGFWCIVMHTLPTSSEPQCLDEEGARTFLPRYFAIAKMRAQ